MPKGQMNQEQREEWANYLETANSSLNESQYKMVCRLHADLYAHTTNLAPVPLNELRNG